jgi:hypothetical protein
MFNDFAFVAAVSNPKFGHTVSAANPERKIGGEPPPRRRRQTRYKPLIYYRVNANSIPSQPMPEWEVLIPHYFLLSILCGTTERREIESCLD